MATQTLYQLGSDLIVTVKTNNYDALSFSLKTKSFIKCLSFIFFFFILFGFGTLLFFRELEKTKKLEDRLLQMEIRTTLKASDAVQITTLPSKIIHVRPPEPIPAESAVTPRVQEFVTDCQDGICGVQLSMVPSQTGVTQGELLIVLEAEVPRIGTAGATSSIRKRFYIYPGNDSRDELTDTQIISLTKKPYRFGKALQTSAEFTLGELFRPIAASLYLYDTQGTLIHTERKLVETGDSNAQ